MNHLEFELVVSVVVVAVILDLLSIPGATVLVVVLVHVVSPVVLVLDEIAFVVDPFVIAVFCDCDEDCGGNCCFCGGDCRWLLLCQILMHTVSCSPRIHKISRHLVSSHGS